ncbi:glycerophosphoryl diester phosphodiesterase membrane domain-containing protein [Altererythrobacter sp. TH136]|uniref:glycerophosphoryl diester phosphodiesterase membrane domain-containing protein n=1 Tax=Altererythrobacter sp. TH136 TaxID=2067415 RepID=UPI001164EAD2|nr:glycerophosphoryl diester phosphodiesterase membrane domain-containing protein [Altererythrobacter sp. TH136]QDM41366.1 hypothetical protein C0V74_10195 [Altererythrobacter sp. TH136]
MKFDMSAAWNEALRLISANRQVITIVAGVFFFLPYLAFMLLFMNQMNALEAAQASNPDPEAMGAAMMTFYGDVWWVILLFMVIQGVGMLGLLTLLTDRSRPTVGAALASGARLFLPYFGAQLLMGVVFGLLLLVPIAVGAGASAAAGVVLGIAAVIAFVYLFVKFLLTPAVIAIERQANPISALSRSWQLTKGNSLRIFLFIFLLFVAVMIVGGVFSMILGLLFALAGAEAAVIGQALVSGLVNAVFYVIFLGVIAAIYRQLAGTSGEAVHETFD